MDNTISTSVLWLYIDVLPTFCYVLWQPIVSHRDLSVRELFEHLHRDLDRVCEEEEEQVHVVVDCCSSRSTPDRMFAFDRMKVRYCHYDDNEGYVVPL